MDLDFSWLTFSPSVVKRNLKLSSASKKSSKLSSKQRQHFSTQDAKGSVAFQGKYTSSNLKKEQTKLPKIDFAVGDNVIQPFGALHDKSISKSRVSKGKENRGISLYTVDFTSDSGRLVSTYTKNGRSSCRRYSSDQCDDHGSARKKRLIEVIENSPKSCRTDGLASKMDISVSTCGKSSGGRSKYFSCSENPSKPTAVLKSEPGYSFVDKTKNKRRDYKDKVNGSVIVISDSSTSSEITDSISKGYVKHSLSSISRKHRSDDKKGKCTLVMDTSDSESDVIEASCETPYRLTPNVRAPLYSNSKPQTLSNNRQEKVTDLGQPKSSQMSSTKYKDIENWLSKMQSVKGSDDDADEILEGNSQQMTEVSGNCTENGVSLDSTAEKIIDNLYGTSWRGKNVNPKKPQTEPCKKKFSRKVPILKQHTESKKRKVAKSRHSVVSSTDSEEFENFLKNVRKEFESTSVSIKESPDFIDDNVQDNSLGFYQAVLNNKTLKKPLLTSNRKMDKRRTPLFVKANRQLNFSSSDSDIPVAESRSNESHDTSNPRTNEQESDDLKKKKNVKRPQKVIVSPVKRILVNKTPKTVGYSKPKFCVNRQVDSNFCSPVLSFLASLSAAVPSGRCHPEAQYYKINFKKKKEELCRTLFKMYNDKIFDNKLPHDMPMEWSVRLTTTAGMCYNGRAIVSPGTKVRTSRIELSTKVCDTADRLRDTLVHELCHAATWIVDDNKDKGHGRWWKSWARKAMREFPELPLISRCHDYRIQTKFTYRCKGCGYSIGRHSKSLNVATKRCGYCYGVFELLVNTRRKSGTIEQQTLKKHSPVGFARFVKENYGSVKKSRTDLKHGDVMRLLGQQFSAVKIGSEAN